MDETALRYECITVGRRTIEYAIETSGGTVTALLDDHCARWNIL